MSEKRTTAVRVALAMCLVLTGVLGLAVAGWATPRNPAAATDVIRSGSSAATGGLTGYDDHAAWTAAGDPTTLIDFDDFASGTQITTLPCIDRVSGFSIHASPPGPVSVFVTASSALPFPMFNTPLPSEPNFLSNDMRSTGGFATGSTTFEMSGPTTAIGAFIADSGPLGNFNIEVFSGGSSLGVITVSPRTLPDSFVGVVSGEPFDEATFYASSTEDSWGLDNLEHNCGGPTATEQGTWGAIKNLYR